MTDEDRKRLLQTLAAVYAYYERELTEFAISVWLDDLAPYPIGLVERAFVAHRRDPERGQWMPKSADVLRHLAVSVEESATVAWARLLELVRSNGASRMPVLDDATRLALESIGGWSVLCRSQERDLPHLQRRFGESFGVWLHRLDREADALRIEADPNLTSFLRLQ